jgi:hypothetical protein
VKTAVINKRAGGMGLISGRKAFQRPMDEGVKLLNAIQDVYLDGSKRGLHALTGGRLFLHSTRMMVSSPTLQGTPLIARAHLGEDRQQHDDQE